MFVLNMTLLASLVLKSDSVCGYSVAPASQTQHKPPIPISRVASTWDIPIVLPKSVVDRHSLLEHKRRYDLGIGKNDPVGDGTASGNNHVEKSAAPSNVEDAVQFLVEHESVRRYPSPSQQALQQLSGMRQKPSLPALIPKRITDDSILSILSSSDPAASPVEQGALPPIVARHFDQNLFDPNTTWIEMLLHEQQQQLLLSRRS